MIKSKITDRFQGGTGHTEIARRILGTGMVGQSDDASVALARAGHVMPARAGDVIIKEGGHDTDVYFLLMGEAELLIKGRHTDKLSAPAQVGELAPLRCEPRSASIRSLGDSAWLRVSQDSLATIMASHPEMWEALSRDLASRLADRTGLVRQKNKRSRLFVGSSAEQIDFIRMIRQEFDHDAPDIEIVLWMDVFKSGDMTLARLEEEVQTADFGLFILHPDDRTESRSVTKGSPRDNVLFEFGMFLGRLGSKRVLFAAPRVEDLKLPSDLDGVTPINYADIEQTSPSEAARLIADKVRDRIKDEGPA